MCVLGTWAEPEAQHYKHGYKPEYPESHYPHPPQYGKPAYPEAYPEKYPAAYPEKYPAAYPPKYPAYPAHKYCDPKAPPKCAENTTNTVCLTDEEYPTYEIKVRNSFIFKTTKTT